jgi:Protein of unknown function (DUF998)
MSTSAVEIAAGERGHRPPDRLTRWLLTCGVVGPPLFFVVLLIEGATRPGYNAWQTDGSYLALSGQGWEQIANFLICGVLCVGLALGLRRALHRGRGATWGPILLGVFGLSLVSAGIFVTGPALGYPPGAGIRSGPETLHSMIHGLSGLVAFTTLAAACFVLARRFVGDAQWRGWALYSSLTGAVVLISLIASNVTATLDMNGTWPSAPTGLVQRIGIIAGWTWIALLAARLLRNRRSWSGAAPSTVG